MHKAQTKKVLKSCLPKYRNKPLILIVKCMSCTNAVESNKSSEAVKHGDK